MKRHNVTALAMAIAARTSAVDAEVRNVVIVHGALTDGYLALLADGNGCLCRAHLLEGPFEQLQRARDHGQAHGSHFAA
ncbi:hypothetical protein [Roseomonas populi]|uniref:Uncharacterized protein n=1 Tax=Roseomonas populi TaxID=3121582 RepID=A0ABT1X7V4_9PROT|nr:hypothetical protein [Roseomonas pecuniae]MCR0983821.1 hypothetical protein [Roseomonas pecuniae]